METCRLSTSHVRIGVPLPGNVYDDGGQLLLSKGFVPDSQEQIDSLLARGMYVEISVFEAAFKSASGAASTPIDKKYDPFAVRNALTIGLNRVLRAVLDGSAEAELIVDFARHVQKFAAADADAAIAASLLDHRDDTYAISHSLTTATLGAMMSAYLGWPAAKQLSTVCAALTMNVGMFEMQSRLVRQATPLTPAQRAHVEVHPEASADMLTRLGVGDPVWLAAIRQHHERPAGDGYPGHLTDVGEESQMLRLLDVLGARTGARADRRPLPAAQVLKAIYVDEGKSAAGALVGALIKRIGLYPPGSFVKLENNEVAVVFRPDAANSALAVAAVTTAAGTPTMQPVRRDTYRKGFAVTGAVTYDKVSVGYDLARLWVTNAPNAHH